MPRLIDADEVKRFANSLDSLSETQLIDVLYVIANEIPTVEAIPVAWIKKWSGNEPYWANLAEHMLDDWEKENGRSE